MRTYVMHDVDYRPDLDRYFERIGYGGSTTISLDTLHALSRAHVIAIPFENCDVLLDRGIDLAPAAVERKLVTARRGGYCFEHNSLMMYVLAALGFSVRPLSARVRIGRPRDYLPARTHVFIRVELASEAWLVDVGVGALSLTSSIRCSRDIEQPTAHEPRRLIFEDGKWFHQAKLGDAWSDVCEFTLEEMPPIDREVANWYTSRHPRSHFRDRLIVARATSDGRLTLVDRELTRRSPNGTAVTTYRSHRELLGALADEFALVFTPDTRFVTPGLATLA